MIDSRNSLIFFNQSFVYISFEWQKTKVPSSSSSSSPKSVQIFYSLFNITFIQLSTLLDCFLKFVSTGFRLFFSLCKSHSILQIYYSSIKHYLLQFYQTLTLVWKFLFFTCFVVHFFFIFKALIFLS